MMEDIPGARDGLAEFFLSKGPKLRCLVQHLSDQIIVRQEHALVWAMYPGVQFLIGLLLNAVGMSATVIHSYMKMSDREEAQTQFTLDDPSRTGPQVLVYSYFTSTEGCNLHDRCSIVHLFNTVFDHDFTKGMSYTLLDIRAFISARLEPN